MKIQNINCNKQQLHTWKIENVHKISGKCLTGKLLVWNMLDRFLLLWCSSVNWACLHTDDKTQQHCLPRDEWFEPLFDLSYDLIKIQRKK